MHPAGCRSIRRGKISEADGGGRAAPNPGLCGGHAGVCAGFEPENGHLVLPVADAQREVMQGAAKDGIRTVLELLEQRYEAVAPDEHRQRAGQVVAQLQQAMAGLCLVEGCLASLSVVENCSRKSFEGNSRVSKNCPGKISGEPNTA
jgi:hypothetical protein